MSNEIETGGPAFPCAEDEHAYREPGMTLRDYFAAKATEQDIHEFMFVYVDGGPTVKLSRCDAKYKYADEMLASRSKV